MKQIIVVVAVAVVGIGMSSVADAAPGDWTFDPPEGPPGTVIEVAGVCEASAVQPKDTVGLYLSLPDGSDPLASVVYPVTPEVPWNFTIAVPDDVEPGELDLGKQCLNSACECGEETTWKTFTVTATEETTTTAGSTTNPAPSSNPTTMTPGDSTPVTEPTVSLADTGGRPNADVIGAAILLIVGGGIALAAARRRAA